ncbi:hypothetical protein [Arthrobacter sp. zg-Y1110]|uniref:hypothetical protein n=1 Tax=Arthrobacter sp. zg-Y1110 TaxID=2886932 RepID=UPI001D132CAA|nr:hypothetical protein [Arthrobacter sp. zg-Y1110]MCC3292356.1 hypothetical protein [Arthrobacter sp. zg-Y1110]UWX86741.1 hypothetical protein N2K99_18025 [Arthrobacter sp. zg-Y1110]
MAVDFRLTEALTRSTQMQHNANKLARTANLIAYVNILLSLGLEVPKELADEIEVHVGDRSSTLSQAVGL